MNASRENNVVVGGLGPRSLAKPSSSSLQVNNNESNENTDPKMLITVLAKLGLVDVAPSSSDTNNVIPHTNSAGTATTTIPPRKSLGTLNTNNNSSRVPVSQPALLNHRYKPEKCLGVGNFAKVILARDMTSSSNGIPVAIKAIALSKLTPRVHEEIKMLQAVQHSQFVVHLYGTFETSKYLCMVMDFLAGGELYAVLDRKGGQLSHAVTQFIGGEILLGLEALHMQHIAFRDLKPENVMFDSMGHVVLIDLGLSKSNVTSLSGCTSLVGTPEYLSPEVLLKQEHGYSVDFWSLGMILHELIMGLPPWFDTDPKEMMRRVMTERLRLDKRSSRMEKSFAEIVTKLLMKQPGMRLGVLGGHAEIKHAAYFSSINWKALELRTIESPIKPDLNGQLDVSCFAKNFLAMSANLDEDE